MSDSNRTQLAYIEEGAGNWGVTPGTASMQKLRFTDGGPDFNIENIVSNEIRSDRQTTDLVQTGADSSGGINFELSYGALDDFFEGALWAADWVGVGTGSTNELVSAASTSDWTLNATNNTITFGAGVTHGIVAGQWIELTGSAADDGYHFVTAVSGQVLTVQSLTTGEVLDETDAATIRGSVIRNGTTEHSYTIEKIFTDKTLYSAFTGMVVDSLSINAAANSILTGGLNFIGKSANAMSSGSVGATFVAAGTNSVMNVVSNVGNIMEGYGANLAAVGAGIYFQELSFNLSNNVRGLAAIGTLGYTDVGVGSVDITGNLNVYFENETLYNKYRDATETGLSFKVQDTTGNAYIFTFPRIKFATGPLPIPGKNTDVMLNMTWQAIRHPTYDYTMEICRVQAS